MARCSTPLDKVIIREYDRLRHLAFGLERRATSRRWQKANKGAVTLYARRWRKKNRKHLSVSRRARRAKRRDEVNGIWRNWYAKNKPKRQAANLQWRRKNHAHVIAKNSRRRAVQKGAALGDRKAISAIYARARDLRRWFNVVVDHVIPLAKGGAHAASNLQIIYRSENESKGFRLDYSPSVVFA
jgi:5-methylcytosine-specific restriction endonuclease McrA